MAPLPYPTAMLAIGLDGRVQFQRLDNDGED